MAPRNTFNLGGVSPKELRNVVRSAIKQGWTATYTGSNHVRLEHSDGTTVFCAGTGTGRSARNLRNDLRNSGRWVDDISGDQSFVPVKAKSTQPTLEEMLASKGLGPDGQPLDPSKRVEPPRLAAEDDDSQDDNADDGIDGIDAPDTEDASEPIAPTTDAMLDSRLSYTVRPEGPPEAQHRWVPPSVFYPDGRRSGEKIRLVDPASTPAFPGPPVTEFWQSYIAECDTNGQHRWCRVDREFTKAEVDVLAAWTARHRRVEYTRERGTTGKYMVHVRVRKETK